MRLEQSETRFQGGPCQVLLQLELQVDFGSCSGRDEAVGSRRGTKAEAHTTDSPWGQGWDRTEGSGRAKVRRAIRRLLS